MSIKNISYNNHYNNQLYYNVAQKKVRIKIKKYLH